MTKKNYTRLAMLVASLFLGLHALHSVSAHEGHKHNNAPASAKKLKNSLKADEETLAAGRRLFNQHCASCHGEDGKSKTEIALTMKRQPVDFTAKEMGGITDGEIYWVVTNGVIKNGMPPFKTKVETQNRWKLTLYVKHLMGEHQHTDHQAGVHQRGDQVMGFAHDKTTHHFKLKTDGGVIEVGANDVNDTASRDQIRSHLQHITRKFSAGDFTAPMLIHDKIPPGVPMMKQLKGTILYQFEEIERGGRIRISTKSPKAIAAVYEFLRFQISDHQTGDVTEVEKVP